MNPSNIGNHLGHQQWPISLDIAACGLTGRFCTRLLVSFFWGGGGMCFGRSSLLGPFHPVVINGGFEKEFHFNTVAPNFGWGNAARGLHGFSITCWYYNVPYLSRTSCTNGICWVGRAGSFCHCLPSF